MRISHFLTALALYGALAQAHAGFSITGTRVIYHEAAGETTVRLQHVVGETPVLLQAWLDDGSADAQPGSQNLPFILTPAVARVEPGASQVIRIIRTRDDLPKDRESLLFFNALEVPPAPGAQQLSENTMRLAMQARMKFFYRPRGLTPSVEQAANLLTFTLQAAPDAAQVLLRVHNPTPYHITLPNLALYATNAAPGAAALAKYQETGVAPMVAPFDDLRVALHVQASALSAAQLVQRAAQASEVRYTVINDQGGVNPKQKALGDAL